MKNLAQVWRRIWERDKGVCQYCLQEQVSGNTHTVRSIFMEQPIDWSTLEEHELLVACNDCFLRFRRWFLLREDAIAKKTERTTQGQQAAAKDKATAA